MLSHSMAKLRLISAGEKTLKLHPPTCVLIRQSLRAELGRVRVDARRLDR